MNFNGLQIPVTIEIPAELTDQMRIMTGSELKLVLYILKHTASLGRKYKRITIDEFQNGCKREDGTRIDSGTGLSRPSILDGLKRAEEHGFILTGLERDRHANTYRTNIIL